MEHSIKRLELRQQTPSRKTAAGSQILWFFPHVAAVYLIVHFCTPWLAAWTRGTLLPLLQMPSNSSSGFEFFFSHLFVFSFVPAFLAGLVNARFKHTVAEFVWVVPTAILAYKLITFPAVASVFQSPSSSAFHQYFGGGFLIAEYRDWDDFWRIVRSNPDMMRGMAQVSFTAPFYAGVGYSVAAWISLHTQVHEKVIEKVEQWEERKFGNHDPSE
jgi:hypothetical protein